MTRTFYLLTGACVLFLLAAAEPAAAADYFDRIWVDGQIGRVGYHLTASLQTFPNDRPANCAWQFNTWEFQGDLPPGLTANFTNGNFEGTPRQPGEWNIPVILRGVGCSNTGATYGDRKINLHFRIDP
jgi:hypothetical protein